MVNSEEVSWKEAYTLTKRALSLWLRECPMLFVSTGLYSALTALIPYLTLYFSARILNELAGAKRADVLFRQVIILLSAEAFTLALKSIIFRWEKTLSSDMFSYIEKMIFDKLLSLDFCAADDTVTYELRDKIQQMMHWNGYGLHRVYYIFQHFLEAFFRIGGAVALSVSLFMLKIPEDAGWLVMLNKPVFMILLALIMIGITILSPYLQLLGDDCWNHIDIIGGNLLANYYVRKMEETAAALDVRMYRQDISGLKYYQDLTTHIFGIESQIARYLKGKIGIFYALAAAVNRFFMGISYLFVCLKAWGGAFGIGSVTQYIGAITSLSQGLSAIFTAAGEAKVNSVPLKTVFEFLDIPNDMYQGTLTVEKRSDRNYEVEFRNVSFRYPHSETYVLKNISLKFKVGERLAVVGENGSGKTTFIKLLCRLYDPTEGEILLNGINIRKYNYKEYMNIFSVTFQDFQLLSFTLGENIGTGKVYDREKASECIEKAGLAAKTASLPNGLDTYLNKDFDESGVHISGGEAQKIAIARALYRDAPFIILDEPTAALDPIAEYEIYTKFNEIIGDKTAIFISHRLSSCRFCDEILVFQQGSVVQQGSHETLLSQKDGKYCQLWNAQAQYYSEG